MPASSVFTELARGLTAEVLKYYTKTRRSGILPEPIKSSDIEFAYARTNGHCTFCGKQLLKRRTKPDGTAAEFLIPLKNDGKPIHTNIVVTCFKCKKSHVGKLRPLDRIPGVNAVSDLIERLAVELNTNDYVNKEKVDALKKEIDVAFGEAIMWMHYAIHRAWDESKIEPSETIADLTEKIITREPDVKERFEEKIKQSTGTGLYKVIRLDED